MLSIVIPCYRSEHNIRNVFQDDVSELEKMGVHDYEFILINDCSPDGTWQELVEINKNNDNVKIINLAKNVGQHSAIMAGFHFVEGEVVVVCDDDGQTPVESIGKMIAKIDEGYDIVTTAWTNKSKRSFVRKIGTRINDKINKLLLDPPEDATFSIFFAARKFVVDEMVKYKNPYPYIAGLLFRTSHNVTTIEVEQKERASGKSGYSIKKLLSLWMNGFTAFSILPLRVASLLGATSSLVGFICGLIIIIRKLFINDYAAGWSSTIAVMLFMFGIVLIVLGLIGEYIGRIYISLNNSPQYVIKEMREKNRKDIE